MTAPPSAAPLPPPPGFGFSADVRVRFVETDAQGVVYHANYLVYCEVARAAYFRTFATHGPPMVDREAYDMTLAHAACDYRAPARYDDRLRVWTRLGRLGTSSIEVLYRLERRGRGARDFGGARDGSGEVVLVCEARTVQVLVDRATRRPQPLPAALADRLRDFEATLAVAPRSAADLEL